MTDAFRQAADIEAITPIAVGTPPHPDTARAEAAERLAEVIWSCLCSAERSRIIMLSPRVREWHKQRFAIADLTAKRDAARAEAERLDAELAAMGGPGS